VLDFGVTYLLILPWLFLIDACKLISLDSCVTQAFIEDQD
jgi:hypothetical protein